MFAVSDERTQTQLGVYLITRANHPSTCADTSPDITHIPSFGGGNIYLAGLTRCEYERRAEGEDVAEGVQDMYAPYSGGGELNTPFFVVVVVFNLNYVSFQPRQKFTHMSKTSGLGAPDT